MVCSRPLGSVSWIRSPTSNTPRRLWALPEWVVGAASLMGAQSRRPRRPSRHPPDRRRLDLVAALAPTRTPEEAPAQRPADLDPVTGGKAQRRPTGASRPAHDVDGVDGGPAHLRAAGRPSGRRCTTRHHHPQRDDDVSARAACAPHPERRPGRATTPRSSPARHRPARRVPCSSAHPSGLTLAGPRLPACRAGADQSASGCGPVDVVTLQTRGCGWTCAVSAIPASESSASSAPSAPGELLADDRVDPLGRGQPAERSASTRRRRRHTTGSARS